MSEESKDRIPGEIWRAQPEEKSAIQLQHFMNRRMRELHSSTRSEVLVSIGSALFFIVVMAWRLPPDYDPAVKIGFLIAIAWILITAYKFRSKLFGKARPVDTAATGLEYYRKELQLRRDHLKNSWLWHGPLFMAVMIFVVDVGRVRPFPLQRRFGVFCLSWFCWSPGLPPACGAGDRW